MSLVMLGTIDQVFESTKITITPNSGGYVDGEWTPDGNAVSTVHRATHQNVSSQELNILNQGGERYTDVQNFYLDDGSVHEKGSLLVTEAGERYTIIAADCRPHRFYTKLTGGRLSE